MAAEAGRADVKRGRHRGENKEGKLRKPKLPVQPGPAAILALLSSQLGGWAHTATKAGQAVWDPCAGFGLVSRAMRSADVRVVATDRRDYGARNIQDTNLDFLSPRSDPPGGVFGIVGCPYDGTPAGKYIARSLQHLLEGRIQVAAWLLPADFDSASGRYPLFSIPRFTGKVVLCFRPEWIQRGEPHPKNNSMS